jgi:ABC-type sulfate/molybdate transport systems ATPase subunit
MVSREVCGGAAVRPAATTLAGIRLDGLVWDAEERVALSGSIVIEPGQVAAVVAAPAAGAALADILVGLAPPVAGTAGIEGRGRPAHRPDPRLVTLVPVGGALLPQRTVAQNIAFGDRATTNPQARDNRVTELAQLFRVAGVLRLHPHRLSPAQRLGVAAARALGSEPHAVVLEDRSGQPDCRSVLAALAGHDVAVVVITDAEDRARMLTDRIYRVEPVPPEPVPPEPVPAEPVPPEPAASGRTPPMPAPGSVRPEPGSAPGPVARGNGPEPNGGSDADLA